MDLLYLSTWSTLLRLTATEVSSPIMSFTDPVQAIQYMQLQNASGADIEVITNNGEVYWLVTAAIAAKLSKSDFYPLQIDPFYVGLSK